MCIRSSIREEIFEKKVNMVTWSNGTAAKQDNNKAASYHSKLGENKGFEAFKGKCFFCKKHGHMKRHCQKYKKWIDSGKGKGNVMIFKGEVLVFETNNVEYARDSGWIDSRAAIHVTNSLQGRCLW